MARATFHFYQAARGRGGAGSPQQGRVDRVDQADAPAGAGPGVAARDAATGWKAAAHTGEAGDLPPAGRGRVPWRRLRIWSRSRHLAAVAGDRRDWRWVYRTGPVR